MPEISVIVPVYKAEAFLRRCVDSVLAQTFTDFELILVDDGSPDNSGSICDEYAERDARVQVIHQPNGGVSSARNAGIRIASGNWLTFIDSDDYVEKTYLEDLYEPEYDLTVVSHKHINSRDGSIHNKLVKDYSSQELDGARIETLLNDNGTYWMLFCWGRAYRRSILQEHNLSFIEGMDCGEDQVFGVTYLGLCHSLIMKEKASYVHVASDSGTLSTTFDIEFFENIKKSEQIVAKLIKERFGVTFPVKTDDELRRIYAGCLGGIAADKQFSFFKKYRILKYLYHTKLFQDTLDDIPCYYPDVSRMYQMCLKTRSPMIMLLALTLRIRSHTSMF